MIELPSYDWFCQKEAGRDSFLLNTFTGSLNTEPAKGFMGETSFFYKVFVVPTEDKTVAQSGFLTPWNEGGEKIEEKEAFFENSPQGIRDAARWLDEQYAKFPNG